MRKYYILYIIIISILNLICINNISALSYSTDIGVSFTFNPTISISLSNSNLDISNLIPGNTLDSNSINVSVSSNNASGYTVLATVGNTGHGNTNLNHSNNIDTFSSISTNANLASLTTDNTWGYSYSIDSGSSWSNYNGLSLYSDAGTTLINKLGPAESSIDFKIAAKASSTQASGTYSNVINFIAITRPNPASLEDAYSSYYLSTGKTKHNGYYVMQDMNSTICNNVELLDSELQVIDIRDDNVYWIAKLRDGHCWMTQNLDLDLVSDSTAENYIALTSENTDLNDSADVPYRNGYNTYNETIIWEPNDDTVYMVCDGKGNCKAEGWGENYIEPHSADMGKYKPDVSSGDHGYSGNWYNWSAAVASNASNLFDTNTYGDITKNPQNSICPRGWRLPTISNQSETTVGSTNEFARLNYLYNNGANNTTVGLLGFPIYLVRSGYILNETGYSLQSLGYYWSSTVNSVDTSYDLAFHGGLLLPSAVHNKNFGFSIRCLAR